MTVLAQASEVGGLAARGLLGIKPSANIRRVENGYVVNDFNGEKVCHTLNEMLDLVKDIFEEKEVK